MITIIQNVHIFDGYQMREQQAIGFDEGGSFVVASQSADRVIDGQGKWLIPGLIDAHTHPTHAKNTKAMAKNGVTSTFAITAPDDVKVSGSTRIFTTHDMALGGITDGRAFVQNEIRRGADYIKIVVEDTPRMAHSVIAQDVMNDIADEAHQNGLLLATHAVSVPTLKMAIDAGTDIHIHVPLEADIPDDMVGQIAANGASCVPTLCMMKGFADGLFYGYHKRDYDHAVTNVKKLQAAGVPIVAGTDANNVFMLPKVRFGSDLHTEMMRLAAAGLSNEAVLQAATATAATAFHQEKIGEVRPGDKADFVLLNADPTADIAAIDQIAQVYIGGKPVFETV